MNKAQIIFWIVLGYIISLIILAFIIPIIAILIFGITGIGICGSAVIYGLIEMYKILGE